MTEQKTGIVAECVCDLPKSYLQQHNIEVVYFVIETDSGVFTDTNEITTENILEYMMTGGNRSYSTPPSVLVYKAAFEKMLKKYREIIHITISSGVSESYSNASKAVEEMGEEGSRVRVFDSLHLSTGIGHIIIKAAEMAESGCSASEIIPALEELRERVSTTFITVNADFLCRSGRVDKNVKKLVDVLNAHPVLMMKNGRITLKTVLFGNYDKAYVRYVKKQLKKTDKIDKKRVFITHAGCNLKMIERVKHEVNKRLRADELIVTKASATISSSCGPRTFGVLFVNERRA